MSGGYAVAKTSIGRGFPRITSLKQLNRARPIQSTIMKLSIREQIRNWLLKDNDDPDVGIYAEVNEGPDLDSQCFRLKVYGASGGTIIETTKYERKSDDHRHSLYVVTEDKDLGEELAKIIIMEQLR